MCLFNVAHLVNGMWKVAPENKKIIFGLERKQSKLQWLTGNRWTEFQVEFGQRFGRDIFLLSCQ